MILRIPARPSRISPTGLSPSPVRLSSAVPLSGPTLPPVLLPRASLRQHGLDSSAFARRYSRNVLFSSGYLDVSLPRVPRCAAILFTARCPGIPQGGFPHSDICGSQPYHNSPQLFAVVHVLPRPLAPRHPPYALRSLTCCVCARQPRSCRTHSSHSYSSSSLSYSVLNVPSLLPLHRRPGRQNPAPPQSHTFNAHSTLPPCGCGPAWTKSRTEADPPGASPISTMMSSVF